MRKSSIKRRARAPPASRSRSAGAAQKWPTRSARHAAEDDTLSSPTCSSIGSQAAADRCPRSWTRRMTDDYHIRIYHTLLNRAQGELAAVSTTLQERDYFPPE